MQVQQLLKTAAADLAAAGVTESELEAALLLQGCLDVSRTQLFLLCDQHVDLDQQRQFQEFVARRCRREPLQYILGSCEFWSLDFTVNPAVLIPRPETEFLLEHVLATLARDRDNARHNFLDLCTGSGVIAVVLATEFEQAALTAADYSPEALAVARKNIRRHGLAERINLLCADLLTAFRSGPLFDVIVSNPPYVLAGDLPGLEPEVRDWEPELALSGGQTGLDVIDRICRSAVGYLRPGGWLFMEIGADIKEPVEAAFSASGRYEQVQVVRDWSAKPRVLQARFVE